MKVGLVILTVSKEGLIGTIRFKLHLQRKMEKKV